MRRGETIFRRTVRVGFVARFPKGMRPSTLEQRREFYEEEFDTASLGTWLRGRRRTLKLAVIPGRHTGIYLPELGPDKNNVFIIDSWRDARDVRGWILRYLPEGVYYDRNRYLDVRECAKCGNRRRSCEKCYNYDGQQLAFDLDPENVDCPYHGTIGERIDRGRGMASFCMYEFKAVRKQAKALASELRRGFDEVQIVYSGRGFHVVVDDESGYAMSRMKRRALAKRIGRRYDIDEWVTEGSSRLMRLPYSLNALVSRKCMKIGEERELMGFDPRSSRLVLPGFLRSP